MPFALKLADVLLRVELEADAADQVELGFEEVDVMFLIAHQLLEQVARDVVLYAVAIGRRFLIEGTRAHLRGEIALDNLLDVLADAQGIEHLHVWETVEED